MEFQGLSIASSKKPEIVDECHIIDDGFKSIDDLNKHWVNYIMQPYDKQCKADELCEEKYGMNNRDRYNIIYEELNSRVYIDENINEGNITTEFDSEYVNTVHISSFIDKLNDLPYFTPIDMGEYGVNSKSNSNYYGEPTDSDNISKEWFKTYTSLGYGIIPEEYYELNKKRIDKLNELYIKYPNFDNKTKQSILDLGWNPEVPFSIQNRIKATENTKEKLKGIITNEFYDASHMMYESYLFSKDNLYLNFDKFESGKSNVCYITGLSGSGKSTLGEKLAKQYNAIYIELDMFEHCSQSTEKEMKDSEVFYEYFTTNPELYEKLCKGNISHSELDTELCTFMDYVISYCNKHKENKYIIEGVQIYSHGDKKKIINKPIIFVNASMIKSIIQRFKRNNDGGKIDWKAELQNEFPEILSWYIDNENVYKKFKKSILSENNINEAYNKNTNPVYVVLVYTASPFGKVIKRYTKGMYTHAAMCIDDGLDRLYSYNMSNNFNNLGGFSIESIDEYMKDNKDAIMCVYTTFVNDDQKRKLKKQLDYFTGNIDHTKYSIVNIFSLLIKKPVELANDMICSQFVDRMMKSINIDLTGVSSSLVTPNDLYKSSSKKIIKVYEGRVDNFNKSKLLSNINKLKKSPISEQESPVQFDKEGSLIIVKQIKDIETEYNKSHKLLLSYDKTDNFNAMKPELCKLWYLNNKLENLIFKKKKGNKEYQDMRARVLNDFNKYLKIVNKNDSTYVFSEDYEKSKYTDSSFKISNHTLKHTLKYAKDISRFIP